MREAHPFLGVMIDRISLHGAVLQALSAISQTGAPVVFACANPHSLTVAQSDASFKSALNHATLVVADGIGITLMGKICGIPLGPRITGENYFFAVLGALAQRGSGRVYFFGSSQKVLDLIAQRFAKDFPSLTLCGCYSPPFGIWGDTENQEMLKTINEAKPDVLWVGMTAPKQEKWVYANYQRLSIPVVGSIGAVFDFYAGTHPRAPQWMCKIGLEWVYRLVKEPKRMWKRNFVSTPHFIALAVWRHVFGIQKIFSSSKNEL